MHYSAAANSSKLSLCGYGYQANLSVTSPGRRGWCLLEGSAFESKLIPGWGLRWEDKDMLTCIGAGGESEGGLMHQL